MHLTKGEFNSINTQEYEAVRAFLQQSCGIMLGENKQYLVQSRLNFLLKKYDLVSFSELVERLHSDYPMSQRLKAAVIDAMTTNETLWFRDKLQFTALNRHIFPELLKKKVGTLKVWSAACSSGQEPFSISISADALMKSSGRKIQIIGTDISETILKDAQKAVYSELSIARGLDPALKEQYFFRTHEGFQLQPEITAMVRFQQFNLLKPFTALGRFDVVFCRNVLIYFSDQVKIDILRRMAEVIELGGYLFLSSTESMPKEITQFEVVKFEGIRYYRRVA